MLIKPSRNRPENTVSARIFDGPVILDRLRPRGGPDFAAGDFEVTE